MERGGNRTFKLILEYDGTGFAGWQVQPGKRTVQGELERALCELANFPECLRLEPPSPVGTPLHRGGEGSYGPRAGLAGERGIKVTAAGRTDAGVHATGQVVSFTMNWRHGAEKLAAALNGLLPEDVAVVAAGEAPAGFDARRWAMSRKYRYTFLLRAVRSPLDERTSWRLFPGVDAAAMRRACAPFRGRHDFTAFTTKAAAAGGAVRLVTMCALSRDGERLYLDVTGEAFLRHMVRFMAGAVAAVGQGRATVGDIRRALKGTGSAPAAPAPAAPAPARGLTLVSVEYGPEKARGLTPTSVGGGRRGLTPTTVGYGYGREKARHRGAIVRPRVS